MSLSFLGTTLRTAPGAVCRTALRTAALGALAAALACGSAAAQSFTIEQVMSAPFLSDLAASAHGSTIAWISNDRGERNIWVAEGPEFAPRQLTYYTGDNGQEIDSVRLTPDGGTVLYARGSELNGAGRSANPTTEPAQPMQQVWAVSVHGGEPKLLGDMGCGDEDCEDIQISPDGRWAAWVAKRRIWIAEIAGHEAGDKTGNKSKAEALPAAAHPATALPATAQPAAALTDERGSADGIKWSPQGDRIAYSLGRGDHAFLAIATVKDGKLVKTDYVAPSVDRDSEPRWSPDGKHLAFLRIPGDENKQPIIPRTPTPWGIWVADAETVQADGTLRAREIWHSGAGMRDSLPHFAESSFYYAAGERIVFDSEQDGWGHLYSISAETGIRSGIRSGVQSGGEPVLLTPGEFEIENVALSTDGKTVIYSSNQAASDKGDVDRRHLWSVPAAGGTPQALTSGETIEWGPTPTGDGKSLLCLGSSATTPAMVYRIADGKRQLLPGEQLPKDFPAGKLVTPKQVTFQSEDGLTIHGQLFEPASKTGRGPAVIFVHGGPSRQMMLGFNYMDYYHNAYAENQYLASLGFTVLSVNYRLGIMYGHDFRVRADGGWRGSSEYKDVVAGAKFLQGLPTVDPKRIGIWGGSYGGLLTALALSRNSDLFAAGVDYHGVHDWSVIFQEDDPTANKAPDYLAARKLAWESSPDASIATWKSPVLLIQGDDDRNVPFNQMVDLVQRLRAARVPFKQIVYPDEIHGFLLWRHWVASYKATAEFLSRQLKPDVRN
jgi:dipeptidyl aminopeptidase/acylaminoacyl peptidase